MAKLLLTPQVVKTATCPDGKAKSDIFDSNCKGLLLETRRTGGKTFYLKYTDDRGKKRQLKLADERDVTLAQARTLADKHRTQIAMGNDPLQQKTERKQVPKLAAFIETNYLPFVKTYKASWKTDEGLLRNHILPAFGHLHLDAVTKSDVIGFISRHRETHKPGSVNRVIILLRYVFNLALKWETPGVSRNPTASIPLLEENNQKERFLTADEAKSLVTSIKQSDNTMLQYIVSALILTGTRKQEVLKARWADFNLDMRIWRIPTSKGGKARHIPISDGLAALLETVPRIPGCEWIFSNPKTAKPYVSVYCSWNTARTAAGLADVRMHDLRHSFASFLVNSGQSLYTVQKLLGHTQVKTTQRYAHLSQESLLIASNEIGKAIPILMAMPQQVIDVPMVQIAVN